MKRRRFVSLAAVAASLVVIDRPAFADDSVTITISQKGSWEGMVPQQGVDEGFFKRANLDLTIGYATAGPDTLIAASTGNSDFGLSIGTMAAIAAFAKGAPFKIVAASFTGTGDTFYYVRADSPLNKFADLNGRTVAFSRPGSSSFTIAHLFAEQEHVEPKFVATGDFAATLTQVMSGQIDVGFSVAPFNLDLINQKKIRVIARGSDVRALQNQTIRVHVGNANFLHNRRDVALRFFRIYAQTQEWMYKNVDKAVANYARYNEMPLETAKSALSYNPLKAIALYPIAKFDQSVKDAIDLKFIAAPLTPEQQKDIFDILPPH